jgi:formylmethanofuran dehydrogenase subunit B
VLWISAFGAAPPAWRSALNLIALCEPTAQFAKAPNVHIAVGRPGVDHDAVMHSSDTGTLVAATATARSSAPSVAEALERIGARLGEADASSC